jgi:hypothetical protein
MLTNKTFNNYNELEEEVMERAFDADEETPLPEDYILDEINDQSIDYLKKVSKQREILDNKFEKNTQIEFEFNTNVNNLSDFENLYTQLHINNSFILKVKEEFNFTCWSLQDLLNQSMQNKHTKLILNYDQILNKYKLHKDQLPFSIPYDYLVIDLVGCLTNKISIKLISHFNKLFLEFHKSHTDYVKNILVWVYFILTMLKTPLVDDDNSVLYEFNKNILYKYLTHGDVICLQENEDISSCKIIFVILSEIFGQKVLYKKRII